MGKVEDCDRDRSQETSRAPVGEGACVASPVHPMRPQRDAVLGFTIGSPQAANVARFDRAAENPSIYHRK